MPFISEEIATNEDITYFQSFGFKDVIGDAAEPVWWAIDRERDIFLFPLGGGVFEIPLTFGLCIAGELVTIEVTEQVDGSEYDHTLKIHWSINKIDIQDPLIQKGYTAEDIKQTAIDAFYGLGSVGIPPESIFELTVELLAK